MTITTEIELTADSWSVLNDAETSLSLQQNSHGVTLVFIGDNPPDSGEAIGVRLSPSHPFASFVGISGTIFAKALQGKTTLTVIKS